MNCTPWQFFTKLPTVETWNIFWYMLHCLRSLQHFFFRDLVLCGAGRCGALRCRAVPCHVAQSLTVFARMFAALLLNLEWFWGDPHFKTLDGGNYTFNGLGEYIMIDAKQGTFQLQSRTKPAQGNSTNATIFSAGVAQETNTSTIEVRVKVGGKYQWIYHYII